MMIRLVELYRKGWLSEEELAEYSQLRQNEYLDKRLELTGLGKTNIKVVKGEDDDIVGWTYEDGVQLPS